MRIKSLESCSRGTSCMSTKFDGRLRTTMRRTPEYHNHGHSIRILQTNISISYRSFICPLKCELVNKTCHRSFSTRHDDTGEDGDDHDDDDDDEDFYIPPLDLLSPPLAIRLSPNIRFPLHVSICHKVVKIDRSSAIKGTQVNNLDMTVARLKDILRSKELGVSMKSMKTDEWRGRYNTVGKPTNYSSQEIAHLLR